MQIFFKSNKQKKSNILHHKNCIQISFRNDLHTKFEIKWNVKKTNGYENLQITFNIPFFLQ